MSIMKYQRRWTGKEICMESIDMVKFLSSWYLLKGFWYLLDVATFLLEIFVSNLLRTQLNNNCQTAKFPNNVSAGLLTQIFDKNINKRIFNKKSYMKGFYILHYLITIKKSNQDINLRQGFECCFQEQKDAQNISISSQTIKSLYQQSRFSL